MKKSIIIVPYANLEGFNSGVNIRRKKNAYNTYMKNCSVACISARNNAGERCDIAFVTNTQVAEPFRSLLEKKGVRIIFCKFDSFNFGREYKWALAFFKLCALKHVVENFDYDYYAYIDSDCYVQRSFDNIWDECDENIMLYDINHGIQVEDYRGLVAEIKGFEGNIGRKNYPVHYGGEFFAANRANAKDFIRLAIEIYPRMKNEKFVTNYGDEFITSLVAQKMKPHVKNAGAYVFRFWTGAFRLVSTCYRFNPIVVLHVPAEKEYGMIQLFDSYISKNRALSENTVHEILHLKHRSFRTMVGLLIRYLKGQIFRK